jgi:hypothetical protein
MLDFSNNFGFASIGIFHGNYLLHVDFELVLSNFLDVLGFFFHVHERTSMHAWIMFQSFSFSLSSSPVLNWAIKLEKFTKDIMISSCTTLTTIL